MSLLDDNFADDFGIKTFVEEGIKKLLFDLASVHGNPLRNAIRGKLKEDMNITLEDFESESEYYYIGSEYYYIGYDYLNIDGKMRIKFKLFPSDSLVPTCHITRSHETFPLYNGKYTGRTVEYRDNYYKIGNWSIIGVDTYDRNRGYTWGWVKIKLNDLISANLEGFEYVFVK